MAFNTLLLPSISASGGEWLSTLDRSWGPSHAVADADRLFDAACSRRRAGLRHC